MPDRRPLPWLSVATGPLPTGATVVRGSACRTRAGLFTEWAGRLGFPGYFGRNWDALADSLADLLDGRRRLTIAVDGAVALLADEPPGQLTTLLTVLDEVAGNATADRGTVGSVTGDGVMSLRLVLGCAPADEAALRERIRAAAPSR